MPIGSIFRKALKLVTVSILGLTLTAVATRFLFFTRPSSPDAQLEQADKAAWLNAWIPAEPMYKKAEASFSKSHELSKALYAHVSQMPAHMETANLQEQIWTLTQDLALPEAGDPQTRLRILVIRGMIEVNYDAATARSTWAAVESLANQQHQYLLASRAMGEQGIAAFLLGDITTAKRQVIAAWTLAKYAGDPATQIRYASVYGSGLVRFEKYKESLGPLNEALQLSKRTSGSAYPTIAITAKIEALSGLNRNTEALALANETLHSAEQNHLEGQLYQILTTRGSIYERIRRPEEAMADYQAAKQFANHLGYWRGLAEIGGVLAQQYERKGQLQTALTTIDDAIQANKRIPDELYFVPRNLAIKAEIAARLGHLAASNELYEKSADLIDSLLKSVPTPTIERNLLAQLGRVYSGYFSSLCNQYQYSKAFRVIEKARGRVEAQALQHHVARPPHKPTQDEDRVTKLNIQLLDTEEPKRREQLAHSILEAEQQLESSSLIEQTAVEPVRLSQLQQQLFPSELLLEYVLDEPRSYVLAITGGTVHRYLLKGRVELEQLSTTYRSALRLQKIDTALAGRIFHELLGVVPEYSENKLIIVVPDGDLHLLPFSALMEGGRYTITSHTFSTVPSGTVLAMLRRHAAPSSSVSLPYVGVAAWTSTSPPQNFFLRAISGPARSQLVPLPESRREVESVAADLPKPSMILLGADATETRFKELPLSQYNVLHLALHAYADLDYPDRSALAFAQQRGGTDDGLLQVREIRRIPLTASLVTLSACNTGVGPVGQAGVNNIVNAFIEAGAKSVVSTLWETEDHATTQFMESFYQHLARDEEKADSLRQAQIEMLNSGSPPYYWASFQLVGEPHGGLNNFNSTRVSIQKGRTE